VRVGSTFLALTPALSHFVGEGVKKDQFMGDTDTSQHVPVLIAGAGPVGLALAIALASAISVTSSSTNPTAVSMIATRMEETRQICVNEKRFKVVLVKHARQTHRDIPEQTHKVAPDIFVKNPTVTPNSIQPIVQQSAQFNKK